MNSNAEQFDAYEPTESECLAHATYWREVASDPRSNAATRCVAHAREAAWITIGLNVAGYEVAEREAYEKAHPVSTVYSRELA